MLFCVCTARPKGFRVCYSACARLVRRVLGYVILRAHGSAGGYLGKLSFVHMARPGGFGVCCFACARLGRRDFCMLFCVRTAWPNPISVCYFACTRGGRERFLYVILRTNGAAKTYFHATSWAHSLPGTFLRISLLCTGIALTMYMPAATILQQGSSLKLFHKVCPVCPTSAQDDTSIHPGPLPSAPDHFRRPWTTSIAPAPLPSAPDHFRRRRATSVGPETFPSAL